ncbi:MAG: phosphatase, partial [Clostridiales bacterium]|nr:phosphatase [Clostridiales bacterium]
MLQLLVDSHSHTIASAHAYSTVEEMARAAGLKGLQLLAITDHAPYLADSSHELHFMNYNVLPRYFGSVEMLYGVELNILDSKGTVDLSPEILRRQDICIASYHTACTPAGNLEENTSAYLGAMENPFVNIIGHPEDGNVPVDFERLVEKAKEEHVLLEVNNSSLRPASYRINTHENILTMLRLCKKMEVSVSVGTDAHFSGAVGVFDLALQALSEADFPEHLIANTDADRFKRLL